MPVCVENDGERVACCWTYLGDDSFSLELVALFRVFVMFCDLHRTRMLWSFVLSFFLSVGEESVEILGLWKDAIAPKEK